MVTLIPYQGDYSNSAIRSFQTTFDTIYAQDQCREAGVPVQVTLYQCSKVIFYCQQPVFQTRKPTVMVPQLSLDSLQVFEQEVVGCLGVCY